MIGAVRFKPGVEWVVPDWLADKVGQGIHAELSRFNPVLAQSLEGVLCIPGLVSLDLAGYGGRDFLAIAFAALRFWSQIPRVGDRPRRVVKEYRSMLFEIDKLMRMFVQDPRFRLPEA